MDAHDDLKHLFRQVGAISDAYREFTAPELPDTVPVPVAADLPVQRITAPAPVQVATSLGEAFARVAAARSSLPDGHLG
jgi:anti-sigma factor RsiW